MTAIIIDDDQRVINNISYLVKENYSDINIIATAKNITEGLSIIKTYNPEILFLDINLPDGTGFDLLKKLPGINFKLIFITAHEEYAVKAFKVSALDFILKPIDTDELKSAIDKARQSVKQEEENMKVKTLLENLEDRKNLKRIILKTSEYMHLVNISDIVRCEADNNYTFFHLTNGKKILVSKTIKEFSQLLSHSGFIRVHQSHLVNASYIDKFVKTEGGYIVLKDDTAIPVSQQSRQEIMRKLEELLY